MIRFVLAVTCCAGIALQLIRTWWEDGCDDPRDHVEAPSHVRLVRWAIVDEDGGDAA